MASLRALLLGVAALLLCLAVSSALAGVPGNMGQDHMGFVVPNAQQAADFLMDVFDCEFDWEVRRGPLPTAGERGWSDWLLVHPRSHMPHVIMVKCGDHHLTQYIEIFQWSSPDQVTPRGGWGAFSDIGFSYLSFTVKDIHAVWEHIRELIRTVRYPGLRFVQDPPMQFPLRGEICTSAFIVAPWGQWIEVTQWSESGPRGVVVRKQRAALAGKTIPSTMLIEHDPDKITIWATYNDTEVADCTLPAHEAVGTNILTDVDTPAFFVDLDAFEHNVNLIVSRTRALNIDWRPVVKAHKSPALARKLLAAGAKGIVVLKTSEAEIFADNGFDDIYIANEVIDPRKIRRVALLAARIKRLRINVDNEENLHELAEAAKLAGATIEVLVEININHNRTGVAPDEALPLARVAHELELAGAGVKFVGIAGYEGHTPVLPPADKTRETLASHAKLAAARRAIEDAGIAVGVVSGGGSSNYPDCLAAGIITELQAGGGALTDALYYHKANLANHGHRIGAFIVTQVIGVSNQGTHAMADAGFKSVGWHPFGGLPLVLDRPDLEVQGLSAEHLKLKPANPDLPIQLKRGDKLVVVPGYSDATLMLHRNIYAVRNGIVHDVWPILAAGYHD